MASSNTKRIVSKDYSDLYSTTDGALSPIISIFRDSLIGKSILEPCRGVGGISDYLGNMGLDVKTNELYHQLDKADYNYDFLNMGDKQKDKLKSDWIISNPPYKCGMDFILNGFDVS